MTNEELKAAFMGRKPVILRSGRYGTLRYKCIQAIRYILDSKNNIVVQAELLDYNGGSISIANAREVFLDENVDPRKPV